MLDHKTHGTLVNVEMPSGIFIHHTIQQRLQTGILVVCQVRMVCLLLSSVQIAWFGFRKHVVLININSIGESLEKQLMFNKSFVPGF